MKINKQNKQDVKETVVTEKMEKYFGHNPYVNIDIMAHYFPENNQNHILDRTVKYKFLPENFHITKYSHDVTNEILEEYILNNTVVNPELSLDDKNKKLIDKEINLITLEEHYEKKGYYQAAKDWIKHTFKNPQNEISETIEKDDNKQNTNITTQYKLKTNVLIPTQKYLSPRTLKMNLENGVTKSKNPFRKNEYLKIIEKRIARYDQVKDGDAITRARYFPMAQSYLMFNFTIVITIIGVYNYQNRVIKTTTSYDITDVKINKNDDRINQKAEDELFQEKEYRKKQTTDIKEKIAIDHEYKEKVQENYKIIKYTEDIFNLHFVNKDYKDIPENIKHIMLMCEKDFQEKASQNGWAASDVSILTTRF